MLTLIFKVAILFFCQNILEILSQNKRKSKFVSLKTSHELHFKKKNLFVFERPIHFRPFPSSYVQILERFPMFVSAYDS